MIVEFIGAPGSGKTTLVPKLTESLNDMGYQAYSVVDASRHFARRTLPGKLVSLLAPHRWRRALMWQVFYGLSVLYRVKFFVKHPELVRMVFKTQRGRPQAADIKERKVLYWFIRLVGYYEFLISCAHPEEALVFDEGFVHRVVQLNASSVEVPDPDQIYAYLDLLPQPDMVINVHSPLSVCEKRVYDRGLRDPFRQKSSSEISQFVENAWYAVDVAVEYIKRKGWFVVEVDNGSDGLVASSADIRTRLLSQFPELINAELGVEAI